MGLQTPEQARCPTQRRGLTLQLGGDALSSLPLSVSAPRSPFPCTPSPDPSLRPHSLHHMPHLRRDVPKHRCFLRSYTGNRY